MKRTSVNRALAIFIAAAMLFTSLPFMAGDLNVYAASMKKPAKVKSLKVTVTKSRTVKLKWSKVKGKKVKGYAIYRNGKLIKRVSKSKRTFVDKKVKAGKTYKYYVKAYNRKKAKRWYNKKTGKYQKKKPAKKYRGKRKKVWVYKYGKKSPTRKAVIPAAKKAAKKTTPSGTGSDPAPGFKYASGPNGGITLTSYNGKTAALSIPSTINGKKVTAIGNSCFAGNINIKTVTMPDTIVSIGDYAFECCGAMTAVKFSTMLKSIGKGAFSGCSQISSITIPDSVEKIGDGAFLYCAGCRSLTISSGLKSLGQFAFAGMESLVTAQFRGNALTEIPDRTFCNCKKLMSLKLPANVKSIGKRAFSRCGCLQSLSFNNLSSVADYAFERAGCLESLTFTGTGVKLGSKILTKSCGDAEKGCTINLPANSKFNKDTFAGATICDIKYTADDETFVKDGGFYSTIDGVKTLILVLKLEDNTVFTVDEGTECIADHAFHTQDIKEVVLPASVSKIEDKAFCEATIRKVSIAGGNESDYFVVRGDDTIGYFLLKKGAELPEGAAVQNDAAGADSDAAASGEDTANAAEGTAEGSEEVAASTDAEAANEGNADENSGAASDADANGTESAEPEGKSDAVSTNEGSDEYVNGADSAVVEGTPGGEMDAVNDEASGDDSEADSDDTAEAADPEVSTEVTEANAGDVAATESAEEQAADETPAGQFTLIRYFRPLYKESVTYDFELPDDIAVIAPYAFSNACMGVKVAVGDKQTSGLKWISANAFSQSGIAQAGTDDEDSDAYGVFSFHESWTAEDQKKVLDPKAFEEFYNYCDFIDDEDPDYGEEGTDPEADFWDNYYDEDDGYNVPGLDREEPGVITDSQPNGIFTSTAGSKSIFSEDKFSGYKNISNGFVDWAEKYAEYNKNIAPMSDELNIYTVMYKGEDHYRTMACVLNGDVYKHEYSVKDVGDDYRDMYLMMDHGLFVEISRPKMTDDLILFSGITTERAAQIAGKDKTASVTEEDLINAIGSEYVDSAMMSTTADSLTAASFSSYSNTMVVIYASKKALDDVGSICIDSIVDWGDGGEQEILLADKARFKVMDVGTFKAGEFERRCILLELIGKKK